MRSSAVHRAVALLRGVNVGGHAVLPMAELTSLVADLGYVLPKTVLQSGNVVFGCGAARGRETSEQTEARLEAGLHARRALDVAVFVRTAAEWNRLVSANPFIAEARTDPSHLLVMLLKEAPPASAVMKLQASITGAERVRAHERQLYMVYPDGIGRSKLTSAMVERMLGTSGTVRNWNTVLKLQALVAAEPG